MLKPESGEKKSKSGMIRAGKDPGHAVAQEFLVLVVLGIPSSTIVPGSVCAAAYPGYPGTRLSAEQPTRYEYPGSQGTRVPGTAAIVLLSVVGSPYVEYYYY